jgi:uroporphyrinogen decarboxylase
MNNRERTMAVLNYKEYDRLPVVHFGFWNETLLKWCDEGHITKEQALGWSDGNSFENEISRKLGFDFNWTPAYSSNTGLRPGFERKIIEITDDGFRKILNSQGVTVLSRDEAGSIPAEVDHLLKDRKSFEELYLPKLRYSEDRINFDRLKNIDENRDIPLGLHCGSLFGQIRDWMGVEGVSYLYADDEDLYIDIINAAADMQYKVLERILKTGVKFDYAHFWEDICFNNGPLVVPSVFDELVGPHYKRFTGLLLQYGINIVSLDCDGVIDSLASIWLKNGVNTMFPLEYGTWKASIEPLRAKFGRELRGVGGMNKMAFERDYKAIDGEIERLKPLVELGGYIPCPDHRIAPDAKWENVQYYCEKMRKIFG